MPEAPWLQRHYPGKAHLLRHAAAQGQLLVVKCNLCRRSITYLATDLVDLCDPEQPALTVPFACSKCRNTAFMRVFEPCRRQNRSGGAILGEKAMRAMLEWQETSAMAGDYGHITVRRPGPVRHIQTWRNVRLGDP